MGIHDNVSWAVSFFSACCVCTYQEEHKRMKMLTYHWILWRCVSQGPRGAFPQKQRSITTIALSRGSSWKVESCGLCCCRNITRPSMFTVHAILQLNAFPLEGIVLAAGAKHEAAPKEHNFKVIEQCRVWSYFCRFHSGRSMRRTRTVPYLPISSLPCALSNYGWKFPLIAYGGMKDCH